MSPARFVVAYATPNATYCAVCGERPWAPPAVLPVYAGDPIAEAMTADTVCHECGDHLIHDSDEVPA